MNLNEYIKRVNDELTGVESDDISLILETLVGTKVNKVHITPDDVTLGSINSFDGPVTFRNDSNKIIRISLEAELGEPFFTSGRLYHGDEIQLVADIGTTLFWTEDPWDVQPLLVISFDDESFTPESAIVKYGRQNPQVYPGTTIVGKKIVVDLEFVTSDIDHMWLQTVTE
jgi:hypothetical protein